MNPVLRHLILSITAVLTVISTAAEKDHPSEIYSSLAFRNLGPAVTSGRITDFAVNPNKPSQYVVATAAGGVWKTNNAGVTWQTLFDDQGSYSIGDVALDPNNPNVVWVGSGENNSQRSVGYGDGVYKSEDGGQSWTNMGLTHSEHIGKILIDPRDSSTVYVAAQGPLWNSGGDRGLYKTTNGGRDWQKVLEISKHTGVSDILFDPRNPDVVYATSYQRRRHVWTLINGGPESTIYKTVDGGKNWVTINKGLPSGDLGRIGIAVAHTQPDTVYAIVEASGNNSGFYRSLDAGASWHKQSDYVSGSPQYYQEIEVDPKNPDRIYSLDTYLMVSDDGGKTFKPAGEKDKHVDNHAIWIDPNNTDHLLVGCDGGIYESWDRAENWTFKDNMSLTQFYRVSVDNDYPFYNVFGGTQDNASLGAPHRTTNSSGIRNSDWLYTQFGDGFKTVIDPKDPNIIYSQYQYGGLARYDKKSGERIQIQPLSPNIDEAQRFNWNSPLLISPHNHKRLYYASQRVFRSDDQGESWQAISGDLSHNQDRNSLKVMDKVWSVDAVAKNKSTSFYGSVVSLSESSLQQGLIYAGTDDGLIQVTQDGGKSWQIVSWPSDVPAMTLVSDIETSLSDKNSVFATFDNHKQGDFKPYVFRSDNNGKSWHNINGNLPERGSVYSIAQDHENKDLLFVGTEFGVFFSQDGGQHWVQLKQGIPTTAIRDIEIQRRENDLVLASFGRGFYVLDNYSALRQPASAVKQKDATIFPVRRAFQFIVHDPLGLPGKSMRGSDFYYAENPPFGAAFDIFVNDEFKSLTKIRQEKEAELIKQNKAISYPDWEALKEEELEQKAQLILTIDDLQNNPIRRLVLPAKQGLQRYYWDLRYPGFEPITVNDESRAGPFVVPGKYRVRLSKLVNGIETFYPLEQIFDVAAIDNKTFPSTDRDSDLAFDLQAGQLRKAIAGASEFVGELKDRLQHLKIAITETPSVDQSLLATAHIKLRQLAEIEMMLFGNYVRQKHSEPSPDSISDYIDYLLWSRSENTGSVTPDQKQRFKRASDGYSKLFNDIKSLNQSIVDLEIQLRNANSAWLPGTLPLESQ